MFYSLTPPILQLQQTISVVWKKYKTFLSGQEVMARNEYNNIKVKAVQFNNETSQGTKRGITFVKNVVYHVVMKKILFSKLYLFVQ